MRRWISLLVLGLAACVSTHAEPVASIQATSCEIWDNRRQFAGRTAIVSGKLLRTAHGYFLDSPGCPSGSLMLEVSPDAPPEVERKVYSQRPPSRHFDDAVTVTGKVHMAKYHLTGTNETRRRPAILVRSITSESESK